VSVLSRLNSNAAGLRMVEAKPLLGFGFDSFSTRSAPYYRLSPDYPMNGVNDLHQVFLANAVDLGLVGGGLWLAALVAAMALGLAGIRRASGEALVWKAALLTYAVSWFIDANFTPLTYPFPNSLLWVLAGVAALQFGRVPAREELREAVPA
jgi:putative inorganic carbon (hco3(-)) transporter